MRPLADEPDVVEATRNVPELALSVLDALQDLDVEISDRFPEYFLRRPLRVLRGMAAGLAPLAELRDIRVLGVHARHRSPVDRMFIGSCDDRTDCVVSPADAMNYWSARDAARERIAVAAEASLAALERRDGVIVAGPQDAPPVLVLNAMGQLPWLWKWVFLHLQDNHRLFLWTPRGTFDEQVDDLTALIDREGLDRCHLAAWCTSAKVALALHARLPGRFESTTLISGAYKPWPDGDHATEWEAGMERFVTGLVDTPRLAGPVAIMLRGLATESALDPDAFAGEEAFGNAVLRLTRRSIQPALLAPFKTPESTLSYCRWLLDFWQHDPAPWIDAVSGPVLVICGGHDAVASREVSLELAQRFGERDTLSPEDALASDALSSEPVARTGEWSADAHMSGVGHHPMVERHETIARLIAKNVSGQLWERPAQ